MFVLVISAYGRKCFLLYFIDIKMVRLEVQKFAFLNDKLHISIKKKLKMIIQNETEDYFLSVSIMEEVHS